jgi:hypothetical protein
MSRRLDEYSQQVGPVLDSLKPRFLDAQQEESLLGLAKGLGLSPIEAERALLLLCLRKDVAVERLLDREMRLRVRAAVADRFLDEGERELLLRQGRELFADSSNPEGMAKRILDEEVEAAGALSESELRKRLELRLQGSRELTRSEWEEIQSRTSQEAEKQGVDMEENELGVIFDQVRGALRIEVGGWPVLLTMLSWTTVAAILVYSVCRLAFS